MIFKVLSNTNYFMIWNLSLPVCGTARGCSFCCLEVFPQPSRAQLQAGTFHGDSGGIFFYHMPPLAANWIGLHFLGFQDVAILSPFGKMLRVLNIPIKLQLFKVTSSLLCCICTPYPSTEVCIQNILHSMMAERSRGPHLYPDGICK